MKNKKHTLVNALISAIIVATFIAAYEVGRFTEVVLVAGSLVMFFWLGFMIFGKTSNE